MPGDNITDTRAENFVRIANETRYFTRRGLGNLYLDVNLVPFNGRIVIRKGTRKGKGKRKRIALISPPGVKVIFTRGVVRDRSSTFSSFKRAILFARLIKIFDAEILELEKKKFDVKILSLSFFRPRASSSRKILRKRLPLSSPLLRYFALMQFLEWPQARSPLNFHQHSQSGPPRRENRCRGSQWLGSLVREGSSFLPSFFLLLFSPFYSMYAPHLSFLTRAARGACLCHRAQ